MLNDNEQNIKNCKFREKKYINMLKKKKTLYVKSKCSVLLRNQTVCSVTPTFTDYL